MEKVGIKNRRSRVCGGLLVLGRKLAGKEMSPDDH